LHLGAKRKQPSKTSSSIINTKKEKVGGLSSKGFEAFGVNINSETVRLCSLYITSHQECPPHEDNGRWTRVNMVARDHGRNIMNMDDDGLILAESLHMVVEYLYKNNDISLVHAGKMEEVVEKLRETTPSHRSPSPKNTKKRKSTDSQKNGYDSEVSQPAEESEYGDDAHQVQDHTDDDEEEDMVVESDDDSQSSHDTTGKHVNQADDDSIVICPDDESDEDHYDPPRDGFTHGYNPTGDICDNLPRLIVKGSGKVYYGVGKKPHSKTDVKKGKGKEVGPKAGDVGFFKMTMMDPETLIRDGTKNVKLNWDYCDFSSGNYSFFMIVTLLI
jgi:hypothetical protein